MRFFKKVEYSALVFLSVSVLFANGAASETLRCVQNGEPLSVIAEGAQWTESAGYLEGSGEHNYLWADKNAGSGDFTLTATLSIHNLDGSAASFVIRESNFGFQGGSGTMFVEGPFFGGPTQSIGATPVNSGETFDFRIIYQNSLVLFIINQDTVYEKSNTADDNFGRMGFRPWRSTMRIVDWSIDGELVTPPPQPVRTNLFVSGRDGYNCYRIPSLITTNDGTVLAFCEARKNSCSDHGDIDLIAKRSEDNGATWSDAYLVYDKGGTADITIGNPCPVVDRTTGTIWLPFCENNDKVFVTGSEDDGLTWAAPVEITSSVKGQDWGWYATGPGVGIQVREGPKAGRLVIPCDHREHIGGNWIMKSHVFYSDDNGSTWVLGGTVGDDTDECQVAQLTDGRLMINMRNYGQPGKVRAVAYSDDYGENWGDISYDATLVEPICQASIIRMTWPENGERNRILFSNPAEAQDRIRMTVRLSYDEGDTWAVSKLINEGPSAYSCLSFLDDSTIGLLFEGGNTRYENIIFQKFTLQWLTDGSDSLLTTEPTETLPAQSAAADDPSVRIRCIRRELTLSLPTGIKNAELTIFSLNGRQIFQTAVESGDFVLEIPELTAGSVYAAQIKAEEMTISGRFIVR